MGNGPPRPLATSTKPLLSASSVQATWENSGCFSSCSAARNLGWEAAEASVGLPATAATVVAIIPSENRAVLGVGSGWTGAVRAHRKLDVTTGGFKQQDSQKKREGPAEAEADESFGDGPRATAANQLLPDETPVPCLEADGLPAEMAWQPGDPTRWPIAWPAMGFRPCIQHRSPWRPDARWSPVWGASLSAPHGSRRSAHGSAAARDRTATRNDGSMGAAATGARIGAGDSDGRNRLFVIPENRGGRVGFAGGRGQRWWNGVKDKRRRCSAAYETVHSRHHWLQRRRTSDPTTARPRILSPDAPRPRLAIVYKHPLSHPSALSRQPVSTQPPARRAARCHRRTSSNR